MIASWFSRFSSGGPKFRGRMVRSLLTYGAIAGAVALLLLLLG